jgi:hypothetical protein
VLGSLGYVTPAEELAGLGAWIFAERDLLLREA